MSDASVSVFLSMRYADGVQQAVSARLRAGLRLPRVKRLIADLAGVETREALIDLLSAAAVDLRGELVTVPTSDVLRVAALVVALERHIQYQALFVAVREGPTR